MDFSNNYFKGIDASRSYTADETYKSLPNIHLTCVGYGTNYSNYLNQASSKPNNKKTLNFNIRSNNEITKRLILLLLFFEEI